MQFDTQSLWIYLHFPQLQLDGLHLSMACDQNTPIAIIDVSSNRICQVSSKAHALGVKLDMGLASASLMYPDLKLHEYNREIEQTQLQSLANQLYVLTSDIVIIPPQGLALRAQNMLHLYGGLAQYWSVIEQCLQANKLHYIAASAYTIQAAKLLALNDIHLISSSKSNIAKALNHCALNKSDIDKLDQVKLARVGIKHYADLLNIPNNDLANRVSRVSMSIINELSGKQASRYRFYQPSEHYQQSIELLYDINVCDKLLPVIKKMLDALSEFLFLRNAHTLSIDIQYVQREHESLIQSYQSIRPIYKSHDWLEIITLQLENTQFNSPVYSLILHCEKYEVANYGNSDMFDKKSTHIATLSLMARLQSKLGKQALARPFFVDDFRPEMANSTEALHNTTRHKPSSSWQYDRPGLLLEQPHVLSEEVNVIKGPERIHTGWWSDHQINRDYYIAQCKNGQQLWVYKTPKQGWYVHGYFI